MLTRLKATGVGVLAMASAQHPIDSALKELRELTESELSGLSRDASKRAAAAAQHSPPGSKASTATGESSSEGQISRIATLSSLEAISELSAQLVEEERWEAALAVVTEEHELMGSMHGEADERTLQVLSVYAGVLWQLGRGRDARDLLDELVSRRKEVRRPAPPDQNDFGDHYFRVRAFVCARSGHATDLCTCAPSCVFRRWSLPSRSVATSTPPPRSLSPTLSSNIPPS